MLDITEDPRRIEVWEAMADHFLDTETRHDIPLTALLCVEVGLSTAEARHVWQHEVSPVVGFNLWLVAGEWAAWDPEWLVERIEKHRRSSEKRARFLKWLSKRVRMDPAWGTRTAIERCIDVLARVPSAADRECSCRRLSFLARHYFDFCPVDPATLDCAEIETIRSLYPDPFVYIMEPALVSGEARPADQRVRAALGKAAL